MKVAFVASLYGHLERFHLPYMRLLLRWGCEVHACARDDRGREELERTGIICHPIPFRRQPWHPENILALWELVHLFRREKFGMVHVHTPVAAVLGRVAAKIAGVPAVLYTAHGFHFYRGAPCHYWFLFYPVEKALARWTDYLITINREDYCRARSFPVRRKVLYVPGVGVDMAAFALPEEERVREAKRRELKLGADDFVLLCVGELKKNQEQLIAAVAELAEEIPAIRCLLAGRGKGKGKLEKLAARLGVADRVFFLGYRTDIPELLVAADVFVLLSRREGLPRAVMEAMAAGKPVIGTEVRGIRDLVVDGRTGFLVPPGDAGKVVQALRTLYRQPELAQKMGWKGRKRATLFSLARVMPLMEEVYREALRLPGEEKVNRGSY